MVKKVSRNKEVWSAIRKRLLTMDHSFLLYDDKTDAAIEETKQEL